MFKLLKQRWGPKICSSVPLDLWHRLLDVELVIPHWHVVSDHELAHISGLYNFRNFRQFKADVEFFLRFYTPVSLQDVIDHLDGNHRLPKRCCFLTFDDGFREIYDIVAPVLYAKGISAAFFLTTSTINNRELCYSQKKSLLIHALNFLRDSAATREVSQLLSDSGIKGPDLPSRISTIYYRNRQMLDEMGHILGCDFAAYAGSVQPYLTTEQIKDLMKKGFDIGAHSIDHPLYSELPLEEQLNQTFESLNFLSKHYQYECRAFAFPYGDAGISPAFFQKAFVDSQLKVSFGTGGMLPHFFSRNLPRFIMEGTDLPAEQIVARQFGKAFLCRIF